LAEDRVIIFSTAPGEKDHIRRKSSGLRVLMIHPPLKIIPLLAILFSSLLSACRSVPAATPTPTETATPLPTSTATVSPTLTPTPTPEPAWYQPLDPSTGSLKYSYAQVTNPRARIYVSPQDALARTGNFGHPPNYPAYVAYTASQTLNGQTYYHVTYGWMDGADLQLLTPSRFTGIQLTRQVPFRFGWVLAETQSVNAAGTPIQSYQRYQVIHEVPAMTSLPGYIAIGTDEWLPENKVALVSPQLPAGVDPNTCRFIYTDLNTQTLSVYQDCQLVFATLISSGKNSWTFTGRFTILYKVEYNSIVPPPESTSDYYIEEVPYFMTYDENFGFHGAYWHDDFGSATSHGCINLSPTDAKWLYNWAHDGDIVIIRAGE
jgi:lipoprotein-anchoring transpeptidase ErfK/SrfK